MHDQICAELEHLLLPAKIPPAGGPHITPAGQNPFRSDGGPFPYPPASSAR